MEGEGGFYEGDGSGNGATNNMGPGIIEEGMMGEEE